MAFKESDLAIDCTQISVELTKQSETFVHYAVKAATRRAKTEQAKLVKDNTEKRLYLQYRDEANNRGEKVTEATLDARVKTSDEYVAACAAYSAQQEQFFLYDAITESYRQRSSMLKELAANAREEWNNSVVKYNK